MKRVDALRVHQPIRTRNNLNNKPRFRKSGRKGKADENVLQNGRIMAINLHKFIHQYSASASRTIQRAWNGIMAGRLDLTVKKKR